MITYEDALYCVGDIGCGEDCSLLLVVGDEDTGAKYKLVGAGLCATWPGFVGGLIMRDGHACHGKLCVLSAGPRLVPVIIAFETFYCGG